MSHAIDHLLERLSTVTNDDEAEISMDGHILRGPLGCVRFVSRGLFLDFYSQDVLHINERGETDRYAIPVRIVVRSGVVVHNIGASDPFQGLIGEGCIPFAISTRESTELTLHDINDQRKEYDIKEQRFLEKYGLMPVNRKS